MDIARAARGSAVAAYLGVSGLLVGSLFSVALRDTVGPTTVAGEQAAGAAGLGAGAAVVTVFFLRYGRRDWSFIDAAVPDRRGVGVAIVGLVAVLALSVGLEELYAFLGIGTASHGSIDAAAGGGPLVLAVGVASSLLFVGPGEELLYRNVIQKHLYDSFSRPGAVAVGSLVFAVMHGPTYLAGDLLPGLASLSVVFALSLVLGTAYVVTENVTVPAAIHGAYNAVSFAVVVLA